MKSLAKGMQVSMATMIRGEVRRAKPTPRCSSKEWLRPSVDAWPTSECNTSGLWTFSPVSKRENAMSEPVSHVTDREFYAALAMQALITREGLQPMRLLSRPSPMPTLSLRLCTPEHQCRLLRGVKHAGMKQGPTALKMGRHGHFGSMLRHKGPLRRRRAQPDGENISRLRADYPARRGNGSRVKGRWASS
jgi:hypothetical protein